MCGETSGILVAEAADFFFDTSFGGPDGCDCSAHTTVHRRLCVGPLIESVLVSRCWMWMLCPRVGCHKSRWVLGLLCREGACWVGMTSFCQALQTNTSIIIIMNVAIFWYIAPCSPYVNRRFGGTYHIQIYIATGYTPASCPADFRLWRWVWYFLPKRRFTYTTRRYITEDDNIHNYRCEDINFYLLLLSSSLLLRWLHE
jgi:hypothetical protein